MSLDNFKLRLTQRLRTVGAVELQRLAQDIAVILDGKRYRNLQIQGENEESQTVKGWPDAYVLHEDGSVDGVEATRSKDRSWQRHLRDDLAKAADPAWPRLNGYLFVAGYPSDRAPPGELSEFRNAFRDVGVPAHRLTLLIGEGLVNELLKPEYALAVYRHLGLAWWPEYFEIIGNAPITSGPWLFEPSPREFEDGSVFRPAIADEVERQLTEHGSALVLGRGAAGKTVLAKQIASDERYKQLPSYYLSFRGRSYQTGIVSGTIENILIEFGGPGVLFIIDDVHLDEALAASIWAAWNLTARLSGTRLLLVGRETRRIGRSRWEDTALTPVVLQAQADEAVGVYRRIIGHGQDPALVDRPPDDEVRKWLETFGGKSRNGQFSVDLTALAAAIQFRRSQLPGGDWSLAVEHAQREIRDLYLAPLGEGERRNLLRLASLPEDTSLDWRFLADSYAGLTACVASGLVFEAQYGKDGRFVRYSLVHSALGKLLLAGSAGEIDPVAECCEIASKDSYTCLQMTLRAVQYNELAKARQILLSAVCNDRWADDLNISHITGILAVAHILNVIAIPKEGDLPQAFKESLRLSLQRSDPHFVTYFLRSLESDKDGLSSIFPQVIDIIIDIKDKFAARAGSSNPTNLISLVTFCLGSKTRLKEVVPEIVRFLIENRDQLLGRLLDLEMAEISVFFALCDVCEGPLDGLRSALSARLNALVELPENWLGNGQGRQAAAAGPLPGDGLSLFSRPEGANGVAGPGPREQTDSLRDAGPGPAEVTGIAGRGGSSDSDSSNRPLRQVSPDPFDPTWSPDILAHRVKNLMKVVKFCDSVDGLHPLKSTVLAQFHKYSSVLFDHPEVLPVLELITLARDLLQASGKRTSRFTALVERIAARQDEAVEQLRKSDTDLFLSTLRFLGSIDRLRPLHRKILNDVAAAPQALASRLEMSNLDVVPALLSYLGEHGRVDGVLGIEVARRVWYGVDSESWNRRRAATPNSPTFLTNIIPMLQVLGRPEMLKGPASGVINHSGERVWTAHSLGFHHLHDTLCFYDGDDRSLSPFIERVMSAEWLDPRYRADDALDIADVLYIVGQRIDPALHARFVTNELHSRLVRNCEWTSYEDVGAWYQTFVLIGCASILGASLQWKEQPDPEVVSRLTSRAYQSQISRRVRQRPFWCGVREMERVAPGLRIEREDIEWAISSWQGPGPSKFSTALDRSMLDWLHEAQRGEGLPSAKEALRATLRWEGCQEIRR